MIYSYIKRYVTITNTLWQYLFLKKIVLSNGVEKKYAVFRFADKITVKKELYFPYNSLTTIFCNVMLEKSNNKRL